jgi:IK cytokine
MCSPVGTMRQEAGLRREGAGLQAYKSNKEMMPKAAFQFGVKMSDGRKTGKGLATMGQRKEQKLETELHKIRDVLDRQGKSYGGAFDAPVLDVGPGAGPSKKRRI